MKIFKNEKLIFFIVTLQESFIAIVPFFILTGIVTFFTTAVEYFNLPFINKNIFTLFAQNLQSFSSIIPPVAVAFFFAKRLKVSEIVAIILSITAYMTVLFYENNTYPLNLPYGFTAVSIFIPVVSTFLLKIFYPWFYLHIVIKDGKDHIYRLFNYIFVFFVSYIAVVFIYIFVDYFMDILIPKINIFNSDLPLLVLVTIRNIFVQFFWFLGMHGEHMLNALFGKDLLSKEIFPNLTVGEFQRIFVSIGGAGAGLALLFSLILYLRNKILKKIVYISTPFTFFNINTILIFISIVLNRYMFIPFIAVPIVNIFISYFLIKIFNVSFSDYYVVWITPVFIDGYLKSESFFVPLIQLLNFLVDFLIYTYFVKNYFISKSVEYGHQLMKENLNINLELQSKIDIKAFKASQEIIDANVELFKVLKDLKEENLLIYYQPKVTVKENKIKSFEALLRYKKGSKIVGPFFLSTVEKAGLAPIMDLWVCSKVKENLDRFKNTGIGISINLHPDTLKDFDAITKIIDLLSNEKDNITFEIVEKNFIDSTATQNINRIKEGGFKVSIDDFGIGYSSLETLINHNIDELKIDKSLIDRIETKKGYLICRHIIDLCKGLGIVVVAEGVETKNQRKILEDLDVDLIQGYVFSPAVSIDEAVKLLDKY